MNHTLEWLFWEPGEWRRGPLPKNEPFFARTSPGHKAVSHADTWLVYDIHGKDCEWAPVVKPAPNY